MYAIMRSGGKQQKVSVGDTVDVERLKTDDEEVRFEPLLVVADNGQAISGRDVLRRATVTARVVGETKGPKVDIFKYRSKTGYRRRMGHRQGYTRLEITEIDVPKAGRSAAKAATADEEE